LIVALRSAIKIYKKRIKVTFNNKNTVKVVKTTILSGAKVPCQYRNKFAISNWSSGWQKQMASDLKEKWVVKKEGARLCNNIFI
jgi:hypothetical protein